MLSIPGTEALSPAVKYVIAFAIIFVLLALFALVLRRLTGGRLSVPANDRRSRQPRLGIVDVYDLDRQRQLILLRRDNVEHLLLIGGPNDVIVETNIVRTAGARLPAAAVDQAEPVIERTIEAPSRPLVEPVQRPEPVVARLGLAEPGRGGADESSRLGPGMIHAEPMLKPDVVALSPAAPVNPARQPARDMHPHPVREAQSPHAGREPPAARAVRDVPPPQPAARAAPVKAPPPQREPAPPPEPHVVRTTPEPPPRQPAPPPAAARSADTSRSSEPGTIADAAVLSNMAKQLEEALKRPLAPGKTGPVPVPNGPLPHAEEKRPAPPPPARAPQPVPVPPPPAPTPMAPASARQFEPAEPAPRPRPAPAPVTRMRPAPEPEPVNPAPPPSAPPPSPEQVDPFSVEEIEAEFARLLGRPLDRSDRPN